MPPIFDLATELLQQIINQIYHRNLVNLALTCRHINKLSQSALKRHQELLSRYSVVSSSLRCGDVVAEFTANVLRGPRIGLYVSTLHLYGVFTDYTASVVVSDYSAVRKEYSKNTMHVLEEASAFLEALFESKSSTWLDSFKEGDEDAVVALLLLNLPNLEHLSLEAFSSGQYLQLVLEYAQGRSDQGCLSRLHSVNVEANGG